MTVLALAPPPGTDRRSGATAAPVLTFGSDGVRRRRDRLATEEPLEIRAGGPGEAPLAVAVTMRTPGHDLELAVGFLAAEGLLGDGARPPVAARACAQDPNVVLVALRAPLDRSRLRGRIEVSSSCGVCGHAALDELGDRCGPVADGPRVAPETLIALPDRLRDHQRLFERTGGLHAAALFDERGTLLAVREDVGRHNALDKALGATLLAGPGAAPRPAIAMLSGRASYELVQKAAVAGVPIVCAVSAPSSLAVDAAHRLGVTLVGFLRGERFNVYARPDRIVL
ncbi:Formate dehydrogenase chain D [Patulibacter medicamentivorans]|uniref:Sulfur carrier protein FdhD n=1 Tax=Patulibacter medicamentivorans TaxID=1097667 RepID=H0E1E7_9ACTN|nr:formate dehydrogenase accessory sulfurtransferase FdhD [Patulibacter medicamentivorans]EHN12501.1 Formate dehydrogenase chain D [Patulibacter medicamentivorans]